MSDTTTTQSEPTTQETTQQQASQQTTQPGSQFIQELGKLGENLGALIKAYWESEERKSVEREVTKGLEQFSKSVNETVEQLKRDDNVKKAKESVKNAWETAHGPQLVDEVRSGILDTLRAINTELERSAAQKPAEEVKPETAQTEEPKP